MAQLFFGKPEKPKPYTPKYGSPFGKENPAFKVDKNAKWEILAREFKARHPEWKQTENEIAAELAYQAFKKEKK